MIERFWVWLAYRLPAKLVIYTFIRVLTYATIGVYKNNDIKTIAAFDALHIWDDTEFGIKLIREIASKKEQLYGGTNYRSK